MAGMMREVFGLERFSRVTVKNILSGNANKAKAVCRALLSYIAKERCAGMDETGVYINKAQHMAEHNTAFSEGTITGILIDFVKCIREQVLMGNTVKINNLAIFKATVEGNGLDVLYDPETDKTVTATMGTLKSGDKTGPAVKVVKLLAQSTGEFTRDELKKDVKFAWTDKTKAEIAAAKGGNSQSGSENTGGGSSQNGGGTQSGGTQSGGQNQGGTQGGDNGGGGGDDDENGLDNG